MKSATCVAAAFLAVAILSGCGRQNSAAAKPRPDEAPATPVAVVRITRHDLARELEVASEFRPYQEIDLHAKVSGYLKSISVDVGDEVKQGQLLAVLEVPEMAQELLQATASVNRASLEVDRARGEVQRAEAAVKIRKLSYERLAGVARARPNLIAQQEIDDAAARLSEAEAQLGASRASLAATEEQVRGVTANQERINTMLAYTRITSPFAGMITERRADPGALVQAGTASHTQAMPLVRLSQVSVLRLVLPVPESIVSRIQVGSPVEVRVDALNRVIQGRVARFNGRLDAATRTMETEVDISNPDHLIKPGMFGYAKLRLDRRDHAIAAPIQAIGGEAGERTVTVVGEDRRLEVRRVETGLETPGLVEITSNLRDGELVVVGNRGGLKAGMRVEPKFVETVAEVR